MVIKIIRKLKAIKLFLMIFKMKKYCTGDSLILILIIIIVIKNKVGKLNSNMCVHVLVFATEIIQCIN
jgi:hypothetical protein